jgi:hypothetical protein
MKRLIVSAPADFTTDDLTPEQLAGLNAVRSQYVQPMPGTVEYNGRILIDTTMTDNFDPAAVGELGLPFEPLGLWYWDGHSDTLTELMPMDPRINDYIAPALDEEGNSLPPSPGLPHNWAGWPAVEI